MIRGPGRPERYVTRGGDVVPSVTTITGRFGAREPLVKWAYRLGLEQRDMERERDLAKNIGSTVDRWIVAAIHEEPMPPAVEPDADAPALNAFRAFLRWREDTAPSFVATQVPLVCDEHRFGGTFDALARIGGQLWLIDWKVANGVYAEALTQVGGYHVTLTEHATEVFGARVLRFDKETGVSQEFVWLRDELEVGSASFLMQRRMYELDRDVARIVRQAG
jgi:hypothetical protein